MAKSTRISLWPLALIIFIGAVLPVAGQAGPADGQQALAPTQVQLILPFTAPGSLGLRITARVTGRCFAASVADSGRPDAWRCMSGNRIYDPCFEGLEQRTTVVACLESPWAATAVVLTPTGGVPRQVANKGYPLASPPWSLLLGNGASCGLLPGTTFGFAGMRINYGCTDGGYLIGDIDRSQPQWRVFYLARKATAAMLVGVITAYY
jgi:eukaryotic-like serine/threonine-protein kinase